MRNSNARSFKGFKERLENETNPRLAELFKHGNVQYKFTPHCDEAALWSNPDAVEVKSAGNQYYYSDKYVVEEFYQRFGQYANDCESFDNSYFFLIKKRHKIGERATSGIKEEIYSYVDFGSLNVRIHAREDRKISCDNYEIYSIYNNLLKDYFLGVEYEIVTPA